MAFNEDLNFKILNYFQAKTELIKYCFNKIKQRYKQRFKEYFLSENSFGHLNKLLKAFVISSIGFSEINYDIKNSKRLKINTLILIILWISWFRLNILLNINHVYFTLITLTINIYLIISDFIFFS